MNDEENGVNVPDEEKVEAFVIMFDKMLDQGEKELFMGFIITRLLQMIGPKPARDFFERCAKLYEKFAGCEVPPEESDWEDIIH